MQWVAPHEKVQLLDIVSVISKAVAGKILRRVLLEQERERLNAKS